MSESLAIQTVVFAFNAGILALLVSERIKMPSIVLYLILGVLLGPSFLNLVHPESLGQLFPVIIELGVAIIMFEGAMHLNIRHYKAASRAIRNLVTVGVVISVVCIMLLTRWVFAWPWGICLLFAVLMSVTGPTVIAPILRRVPLKQPIGSILHWESILLEPIVVIGAILIVEFLLHAEVTLVDSLFRLFKIAVVGGLVGGSSGVCLRFTLKRYPPKHEGFRNLMLLAIALLIFEISNWVSPDSGLVAVVFAGLILGNSPIPALYEIKQFKETITRVMISFLFILLAANLDREELTHFPIPVIFLLVMMIFVIRPAVVFTSLIGSNINLNSKIFLSLTAPRGIVAASMASLLAIVFTKQSGQPATQFEILSYQVIFITVFAQALWSKPLAFLLKVREEEKRGFLMIGAHPLAVALAQWVKKQGLEVLLVDRDSYDIYLARKKGVEAHKGDALNEYFIEQLPLQSIGNLLALTSNDEVNTLACQLGKRYFEKTFQIHKTLREKEEGFLKTASGTIIFPNLPPLLPLLESVEKKQFVFREIKGVPPETFLSLLVKLPNGVIQPVTNVTSFNENSLVFGLEEA